MVFLTLLHPVLPDVTLRNRFSGAGRHAEKLCKQIGARNEKALLGPRFCHLVATIPHLRAT
jgi:hypothetical protein